MKEIIKKVINDSIEAKRELLVSDQVGVLEQISQKIIDAYKNGKKIVVFGNGGSAADAQHFVAELVCRFQKDRRPLAAIALSTNTSTLTSVGNDYNFNDIFTRQVEALADEGDIVVGISTSGNSPNVLKAIEKAKDKKAVTVGMGGSGGELKNKTDICLSVPSKKTARVQECHILAIHVICLLIEETLFGGK